MAEINLTNLFGLYSHNMKPKLFKNSQANLLPEVEKNNVDDKI